MKCYVDLQGRIFCVLPCSVPHTQTGLGQNSQGPLKGSGSQHPAGAPSTHPCTAPLQVGLIATRTQLRTTAPSCLSSSPCPSETKPPPRGPTQVLEDAIPTRGAPCELLYAAVPTAGSWALPHRPCSPQEAARRTPAAPSPRTRAGRAGAAPAVPAAPRTAASRDGDGRGASLAGRPRPAPPSSPPPAASSSAGHSAGRRRRPSLSSPPLRPRRAVSLGQGSLRRLPGMANATAAPHPPRRRRRRHFAGEPAGTTPIGRRRTAPGRHWPRSARAGRRMRRGTAAGLQPLCSVLAPRAHARSPAARLGGKP